MKRTLPTVLFVAAALYFSVSRNLTLDLTDEGQVVYPSWLVATGAIPHREFHNMYGPSLYLFNGTLFSIFGTDLAVLRWLLVFIKAAIMTVVFLASRAVASTFFALLAYGLCVCVWGTPWWVFNAPYANHYSLLLTMLGLLGYWALRRRIVPACLVAGVCFGLASTFKPTSGVFAALALTLFLIWDTQAEPNASAPFYVDRGVRALRMLALIAVALISIVYLALRNTAWNAGMLFSPLALSLLLLLYREIRPAFGESNSESQAIVPSSEPIDPTPTRVSSIVGMAAAGAGMIIPVAAYGVYYAILGGLGSIVSDLLTELPSRMRWFAPLGLPEMRPTLVAAALVGVLVAWRTWRGSVGDQRVFAYIAVAVAVGSMAVLLHQTIASPGIRPYALMMFWHDDLKPLAYVIPFAVVWTSAFPVLLQPQQTSRSLGLFYFFAVVSLLFLYPAADFWHVIMGLPAFLPLLAYQLERSAVPAHGAAGAPGMILAAAIVLLLSAPFVDTLRFVLRTAPVSPPVLTRATGVATSSPEFSDTVALVQYLDAQPSGVPMLTLASQQMLYFLADRKSAITEDEFVLYLVGTAAIADDDARALISQPRLIERIQAAKPLIVDVTEGEIAGRFQRVFPEVAAFVATHYRPAHTAGNFRVLRWTDA